MIFNFDSLDYPLFFPDLVSIEDRCIGIFRVHECGFDHCCELKDCVSKVIFEFSQVLGINSQVFSLLDSSS